MSRTYYPPADDLAGLPLGQLQSAYDAFVAAHDLASRPPSELLAAEVEANGPQTPIAAWLRAFQHAWGAPQ